MALNESLSQLSGYLLQTLSPDINVRKPAEKYLQSFETREGFSTLLLQLIDCNEIDLTIRISASIAFKNFVKRNWCQSDDSTTDKISLNDRNHIKKVIIDLMLKSPEQIQRQLSDSVSIIGREDFPEKWPNLLDDMIIRMNSTGNQINFNIINGVLQTAHSLFKRYRHEFKSNDLWTEIKYVLSRFAQPFTDLFVWTVQLANTHSNNPQNLKIIFSSLVLCTKIFYSLNAQDLPEFFEDNMSIWMKHFLDLLSSDNKLLQTEEEEEAGLLEQLKSQICDNIGMYAQKYNEEFENYLPGFVQTVWNLLINTGPQPKYDLLVSNAIHFLSTVADRNQYQCLFQAEGVLDSISSKIIVPNMEFRVSDEELFEDNPEEYIRRDIEGSDVDTRRRAACDLVKSLSRYFEEQMTTVFSQYIQIMLTKYNENPMQNWKSKDAAIYLVTSMAVKGGTARLGTTNTSELVNITDFFTNFVRQDLERQNLNELPVLRADALKYIMTFRNQLPLKEVVIPCMPLIIQHMSASSRVVHTYASHTLEKLLTMRDSSQKNSPSIKAEDLNALIGPMLNGLFGILSIPGSTENEYAIKAIMRSFSLLQENVLPYFSELLPKLTNKLSEVTKNPSKPHFNHYLFETLSLSIRIACQKDRAFVTNFESVLFPIFQEILIQDVQEFMPYVFQILSLLLEIYENMAIPEPYMQLFPHLLAPILWDRPANIAPLVRLLQAFIEKGSQQIIAAGKIQPLLGVFQKLIASKNNDNQGFYLLQSLIEFADSESLASYMKQIFFLLFQRLTSSKTTKFVKSLLVFFSLFAYKYGAQSLVNTIDTIQQRMFGMVLEKLFIPEAQRVSGNIEKKILAIGMIKILCELDSTIVGEYSHFWAPLLQSLVALFELPEDDTIPDDEHFIEIEDTPGYQATYSQLIFAGKKERDPFEGVISDPRLYLAQSLGKLSVRHPGKLNPLITSGLQPNAVAFLQSYIQRANVSIA